MKSDISTKKNVWKTHKSYTPEEVFAAGGTTAFGLKMGKNNETMIKALQNAPPIEPFTEEEWADLMEQVARDK
jgi:hypothetical protein